MGILLVLSVLILIYFHVVLTEKSSIHYFSDSSDEEVLLKMARDFRDGANKIDKNPSRAIHFYQFAIEKGQGKVLTTAILELLSLLEEFPGFVVESKYSSWDLLVAAASRGHEDAQHKLSVALSTGIFEGSIVLMDSTRSLLLEYMAALSGHPEAAMGMGYRYSNGIGVVESCEKALLFYEIAANHAVEYFEEKNGFVAQPDRSRLSESVDQSLKWLKESSNELTDYYAHLAASGESTAASLLGNLYATGSRNIEPSEELAIHFLKMAVRLQYSQASGLLGYLLARRWHKHRSTLVQKKGQPEEDFPPAKIFALMQNSLKSSDLNGIVGLGFCYMHGIGVEANQTKALEIFHKVLPTHPDAGFYIGEIIMKSQLAKSTSSPSGSGWRNHEIASALHAYSSAAQLGNILAQHRVAQMNTNGWGSSRSCESAVAGFKSVAERGPWAKKLSQAHRAFGAGDFGRALQLFSSLAAVGYESAQYNAAFLLFKVHCPPVARRHADLTELVVRKKDFEQEEAEFSPANYVTSLSSRHWEASLPSALPHSQRANGSIALDLHKYDCDARALSLFSLSAAQGNSDSYVQMGDFYYYRFASFDQSRRIAATYYQKAADLHNTQAIFNLGLMHEIGDGVNQDFHLAKRYYDLAAEVDAKARTPRDIALLMLETHKNLLAIIHSDWLGAYVNPAQLELWLADLLREVADVLRFLDASLRSGLERVKRNSLVRAQSHRSLETYVPEKTRFQFIRANDFLRSRLGGLHGMFRALKTELQKDLRMKEEEASLLVILSALLVALIFLQLFVSFLLRRRRV